MPEGAFFSSSIQSIAVLERGDRGGEPRAGSEGEQGATQPFITGTHLVRRVHRGSHVANHLFRITSDDGRERATHPDIRLEGRSSLEEAVIRGRDMGVGPEDGRYPTIEMECQSGLLRRRLHVCIDQDALRPGVRGEEFIGGLERIVGGKPHEDPSEKVEDQEFPPARLRRQWESKGPLARCVIREVRRAADRFLRILEQWNDPSISIDVIAERDAVDAEVSDRAVEVRGQSRPVSEVFGIRNDQIRGVIAADLGKSGREHSTAGSPVEIAKKGDSCWSRRAGDHALRSFVLRLGIHGGITVHSRRRIRRPFAVANAPPTTMSRKSSGAGGSRGEPRGSPPSIVVRRCVPDGHPIRPPAAPDSLDRTMPAATDAGEPQEHTTLKHKQGDQVRHPGRPEWGLGEVMKVELITRDGRPDRRVWIKFPSEGTKTVLASVAGLETIEKPLAEMAASGETLADREADHEGGWLGAIAKNRPEDAMIAVPDRATDPFIPVAGRLKFIYGLYRFNRSGGSLIDWAIAQTGLDDPLSRFNRHELEQFFERWCWERDRVLARTIDEGRRSGDTIDSLLRDAPAAARRGLKKAAPAR